ncbi:MAG: acetyl-CoA C-acyltransferase [Candidatus Krumholzibacteria bacterium]|nr:acetyl-CoA C-acyltransferase [Candidatus Krumholzibacteria bacterium]MDH4336173.1 acetyl-CoA C-acyltransferase [Candidatus Krumholzibacteria bacterium]MDH5268814.1 acetyl-CoA C-acyltransferase [Candidatus Krumholzibacteria bacterium]
MRKRVVILGGARTPMAEWAGGKRGDGKPGGALKDVSALELGAVAARGAMEKAGVAPEKIEHVVMGNALQTSGDALYGARHVGLKAGIPLPVPALTVNRLCGSGIQSIVSGAYLIGDGAGYILAGGMENLSQAPHVIRGARTGIKLGQGQLEDSLYVSLMDPMCGLFMAQTAERLAARMGISREAQDEYALRSTHLGEKAANGGAFVDEVVPVEVRRGTRVLGSVERDDHFYVNATLEGMAKLPPAFGKDGTVTAGNASGMVDGAACVVIADADVAAREGRVPIAEVVDWHVVGVEPSEMGIGPSPAIRGLLKKTGLRLDDIDLFEINEAFSAQYLAVEKDLGLDRDKVNVNGGAIALGHPLGATGTRLVLTLALELGRRKKTYGIASACIGGGQGIAILIKR